MYITVTPVGMGRVRGLGSARRGLGCGCGCGGGCGQQQIPGVGQVVATTAPAATTSAYSFTNLGTDITSLAGDLFLNSDGSPNWTAIGFAGFVGILIYVNWGNTTSKRYRGK